MREQLKYADNAGRFGLRMRSCEDQLSLESPNSEYLRRLLDLGLGPVASITCVSRRPGTHLAAFSSVDIRPGIPPSSALRGIHLNDAGPSTDLRAQPLVMSTVSVAELSCSCCLVAWCRTPISLEGVQ